MNLVEKWAQELGLCEDFVNSRAGSLGSRIIKGVEEGVKVCPRASSEDEFFFSFSDTSRLELSGVFRTAIPPLREISLVIYPSALFILVVHLLIMQVAT